MKFLAAIVATIALVNAVNAAPCSEAEHAGAYTRLSVLMSMNSFFQCADQSGYSLLYSESLPDQEQVGRMCASAECTAMVQKIVSLNPPNCELNVITSGLQVNVFELTNGFAGLCALKGITAPALEDASSDTEGQLTFNVTTTSLSN